MRSTTFLWLATALAGLSLSGQARAQNFGSSFGRMPQGMQGLPGNFNRPTVSSYVNLGRSGNPGLNYFGIVRPQVQARSMLNQQRQDLRDLDRRQQDSENQYNLPKTGHGAYFNTYSHYFRMGQ